MILKGKLKTETSIETFPVGGLMHLWSYSKMNTIMILSIVTHRATSMKIFLCHMWTTKVQISLHICAVWSAPLLFAAYIVHYFKSLACLYSWAGWFESYPVANLEDVTWLRQVLANSVDGDPNASLGSITQQECHAIKFSGWSQQCFGCPTFLDFLICLSDLNLP